MIDETEQVEIDAYLNRKYGIQPRGFWAWIKWILGKESAKS